MKEVINEYLPIIVSYAITIISYILFLIIRIGTKKTGNMLKTLIKDKLLYIDNENSILKSKFEKEINIIKNEMKKMSDNQKKLEQIILILLGEDEDDGKA